MKRETYGTKVARKLRAKLNKIKRCPICGRFLDRDGKCKMVFGDGEGTWEHQ